MQMTESDRVPRAAYALLACILVIAAVLRFVQLDYAPSGGHGDVAWIGINALDWTDRGIWPFYVRELYAPEFFPVYLTGLLLPITGISFLPQRIITAVMGVLFVAFLFPATRWLLDGRSNAFRTSAGLFAALGGAVSLHVVALNRLGMESPPFLTVLTLVIWLTAKAWRRGGTANWIAAGAALALAQYVFLAARLLPVVLALWIAHGWLFDRARMRMNGRGWLVMAVSSFILTLPALILFITTPEAFSARADAGTAQTGGWIWQYDTAAYGGILALIIQKIGLTLLAFGIHWHGPYNIMNLPMLGPLFFAGFLIALPNAFRRFREIAYGWPLLAIPVMLFTDLISGAVLEIHALHQMGVLPFVYILGGIGLAHLWEWLSARMSASAVRTAAIAVLALIALVPAYFGMSQYLNVVIPAQYTDPQSGWGRAQTDVDLGQYLVAHADQAFLLPYAEYSRSDVAWVIAEGFRQRHSAVSSEGLLDIPNAPQQISIVYTTEPERPRHDGFPSHFDPRLWVLLHDNTVWLLPPLTPEQEETILAAPEQEPSDVLIDRSQTEIARIYQIQADLFAPRPVVDYPLDAVFNDEIRLLGYTLPDQNLQPGDVNFVSLFWQPLIAPREDYEVFVQFWTDDQTSIGGAHDFPYGGMYRSRIWQPDEIVVTHHWLTIPADLQTGRYTLVAGLFRLLHNERLPVSGSSTDSALRVALAPDLRYPPPPPEIIGEEPETPLRFGDFFSVDSLAVHVNDISQSGSEWQVSPGDTLTVDLFWDVQNRPAEDYSVFLHLSNDPATAPLAQADMRMGSTFPSGAWHPGDVIHDQLVLTIPADLEAGEYDLLLGTYFWQTGERLPAYAGEERQPDDRIVLGTVIISDQTANTD